MGAGAEVEVEVEVLGARVVEEAVVVLLCGYVVGVVIVRWEVVCVRGGGDGDAVGNYIVSLALIACYISLLQIDFSLVIRGLMYRLCLL